jgi:hypothetical protein
MVEIFPVGSRCCITVWLSTELMSGSIIPKVIGRNRAPHNTNPVARPYTGAYLPLDTTDLLDAQKGTDITRPIILPVYGAIMGTITALILSTRHKKHEKVAGSSSASIAG